MFLSRVIVALGGRGCNGGAGAFPRRACARHERKLAAGKEWETAWRRHPGAAPTRASWTLLHDMRPAVVGVSRSLRASRWFFLIQVSGHLSFLLRASPRPLRLRGAFGARIPAVSEEENVPGGVAKAV
jgi:hypothetical protein